MDDLYENSDNFSFQSPLYAQKNEKLRSKTPMSVDTAATQPPVWAMSSPGMNILVEEADINWAISNRRVTMERDETFRRLLEYAGQGLHEKIIERDFIFHVAKYSTSVPKEERLIDRGDDKVSHHCANNF